jgi:hypothetical protein
MTAFVGCNRAASPNGTMASAGRPSSSNCAAIASKGAACGGGLEGGDGHMARTWRRSGGVAIGVARAIVT